MEMLILCDSFETCRSYASLPGARAKRGYAIKPAIIVRTFSARSSQCNALLRTPCVTTRHQDGQSLNSWRPRASLSTRFTRLSRRISCREIWILRDLLGGDEESMLVVVFMGRKSFVEVKMIFSVRVVFTRHVSKALLFGSTLSLMLYSESRSKPRNLLKKKVYSVSGYKLYNGDINKNINYIMLKDIVTWMSYEFHFCKVYSHFWYSPYLEAMNYIF